MSDDSNNAKALIASADARYEAIVSFSEWAGLLILGPEWSFGGSVYKRLEEEDPNYGSRQRALATVLRVAAAETGAVEDLYELSHGMTLNIADDQPGWQDDLRQAEGPDAVQIVNSQIASYEKVLQLSRAVETEPEQVTQAWIRALHEQVTEAQDAYTAFTPSGQQLRRPLPRGTYKVTPNHFQARDGSLHPFCPVDLVNPEMARLTDELSGHLFTESHPVLQAAYSHWALTHIHPFTDGNGRLARAVASYFLMIRFDIPLLIFADRKKPYINALEEADHGNYQIFADYINGRVIDAGNWVKELTESYARPTLLQDVRILNDLLLSQSGENYETKDSASLRVRDHVVSLTHQLFETELRPIADHLHVRNQSDYVYLPEGSHRKVRVDSIPGPVTFADPSDAKPGYEPGLWFVVFKSVAPSIIQKSIAYRVLIATNDVAPFPIKIQSSVEGLPDLDFRLDDVSPSLSAAVSFRLLTYIRRSLSILIQDLHASIEASLRTYAG